MLRRTCHEVPCAFAYHSQEQGVSWASPRPANSECAGTNYGDPTMSAPALARAFWGPSPTSLSHTWLGASPGGSLRAPLLSPGPGGSPLAKSTLAGSVGSWVATVDGAALRSTSKPAPPARGSSCSPVCRAISEPSRVALRAGMEVLTKAPCHTQCASAAPRTPRGVEGIATQAEEGLDDLRRRVAELEQRLCPKGDAPAQLSGVLRSALTVVRRGAAALEREARRLEGGEGEEPGGHAGEASGSRAGSARRGLASSPRGPD